MGPTEYFSFLWLKRVWTSYNDYSLSYWSSWSTSHGDNYSGIGDSISLASTRTCLVASIIFLIFYPELAYSAWLPDLFLRNLSIDKDKDLQGVTDKLLSLYSGTTVIMS